MKKNNFNKIFEIEQRAKLSEIDFNRCKEYLDKNGKFLGTKMMKTFLFRSTDVIRVRLIKGDDQVYVTHKTGNYNDKARKETELKLTFGQLPKFVEFLDGLGFSKCSYLRTTRHSYAFKNVKVEFNEIDYLGLIVEVEALTSDEAEINSLSGDVEDVLKILNLNPLDPEEYQKMMDEMFANTLRPACEQEFII